MFDNLRNWAVKIGRRRMLALAATSLLAACQVIPKGPPAPAPTPPPPTPTLPADSGRHRVALLVPMAGPNAAAGQSLVNAAQMAVLDMNAQNLRITTYDTFSQGAPAAAARAVADGNKLILGPLLGDDALAVAQTARAARVPVISYSNDVNVAGEDVFVMGNIPGQSIDRVVRYARSQGALRFAALIPVGTYGERASKAMIDAVRDAGGALIGMEGYDRTPASLAAAARRLKGHGVFDAVLIADTAAVAAQAAPMINKPGQPPVRLLGTALWAGESVIAHTPALAGAWFAALPDAGFRHFAENYRLRFATPPYRISTLGYDSVLLTLRVARDWQPGTTFPTARLFDHGGFYGSDGAFRFGRDEVVQRALEVREARAGSVDVVSPAVQRFQD